TLPILSSCSPMSTSIVDIVHNSREVRSSGSKKETGMRRYGFVAAVAAVLAALAAAAVAVDPAPARTAGTTLSLVAYSTPRDAYTSLIPLFQKTANGDGVSFTQSYGGRGDPTGPIIAGLEADVIELSLAPDMDQLVKAGIVDAKWKKQSYKG